MNISFNKERIIMKDEEGDKTLSLKRTNKNSNKVVEVILGEDLFKSLDDEGEMEIELDEVGQNMFKFMTEWSDDLRSDVKFWVDAMEFADLDRDEYASQIEATYIANHMTK